MPRISYIYDEELKRMVEKGEYYANRERQDAGHYVRGDIEPFVSPIDGSVIGSRSDLRSHMRKHDVVHTAEMSSEWAAAAQRREAIRKGKADKEARISSLRDSFERARDESRARARY